jgi:anti-sigma-K factor RskA
MHAAGTFRPTTAGSVRAPATVGAPITAMAVSVEPAGGSPQPTTKPVYQVILPS